MKPTPGPWKLDNQAANGESEIGISRSWDHGGASICVVDSSRDARQLLADANLIAEAGTVYHETGLTPREILAQRDELSRAVENARQIIASLAEGESCDHDAEICYRDTTEETPCH